MLATIGVLEEGLFVHEGNVYIKRFGKAMVGFQSDDINIVTETGAMRLGTGSYSLLIDYNGYEAGKIKVRFRVKE